MYLALDQSNNAKVQLDYILINKKWINSTFNGEVYSSFEVVSFNHRIISTKIHQSLHGNKKQLKPHIMTAPRLPIGIYE